MITKAQIRKNLKDKLGGYLLIKGVDEEKIIDFIQGQIMEYEKPVCMSCYDKGFSSNFHGTTTSSDFAGQKIYASPIRSHILYCHCERGQELKKLIETNYNPIP